MNLLFALLATAAAGWHTLVTTDPMDDSTTAIAVSSDPDAPTPDYGILLASCAEPGYLSIGWAAPDGNTTHPAITSIRIRVDKAPVSEVPVKRLEGGYLHLILSESERDALLAQLALGTQALLEVRMLLGGTVIYTVPLHGAAKALTKVRATCLPEQGTP